MTPLAFVFGTEFSRESVRVKQQENYDRRCATLRLSLPAPQAHSGPSAPMTVLPKRRAPSALRG